MLKTIALSIIRKTPPTHKRKLLIAIDFDGTLITGHSQTECQFFQFLSHVMTADLNHMDNKLNLSPNDEKIDLSPAELKKWFSANKSCRPTHGEIDKAIQKSYEAGQQTTKFQLNMALVEQLGLPNAPFCIVTAHDNPFFIMGLLCQKFNLTLVEDYPTVVLADSGEYPFSLLSFQVKENNAAGAKKTIRIASLLSRAIVNAMHMLKRGERERNHVHFYTLEDLYIPSIVMDKGHVIGKITEYYTTEYNAPPTSILFIDDNDNNLIHVKNYSRKHLQHIVVGTVRAAGDQFSLTYEQAPLGNRASQLSAYPDEKKISAESTIPHDHTSPHPQASRHSNPSVKVTPPVYPHGYVEEKPRLQCTIEEKQGLLQRRFGAYKSLVAPKSDQTISQEARDQFKNLIEALNTMFLERPEFKTRLDVLHEPVTFRTVESMNVQYRLQEENKAISKLTPRPCSIGQAVTDMTSTTKREAYAILGCSGKERVMPSFATYSNNSHTAAIQFDTHKIPLDANICIAKANLYSALAMGYSEDQEAREMLGKEKDSCYIDLFDESQDHPPSNLEPLPSDEKDHQCTPPSSEFNALAQRLEQFHQLSKENEVGTNGRFGSALFKMSEIYLRRSYEIPDLSTKELLLEILKKLEQDNPNNSFSIYDVFTCIALKPQQYYLPNAQCDRLRPGAGEMPLPAHTVINLMTTLTAIAVDQLPSGVEANLLLKAPISTHQMICALETTLAKRGSKHTKQQGDRRDKSRQYRVEGNRTRYADFPTYQAFVSWYTSEPNARARKVAANPLYTEFWYVPSENLTEDNFSERRRHKDIPQLRYAFFYNAPVGFPTLFNRTKLRQYYQELSTFLKDELRVTLELEAEDQFYDEGLTLDVSRSYDDKNIDSIVEFIRSLRQASHAPPVDTDIVVALDPYAFATAIYRFCVKKDIVLDFANNPLFALVQSQERQAQAGDGRQAASEDGNRVTTPTMSHS